MDGFGWSSQQPPAAASCPSDALLAAFLGGASGPFELPHSAGAGDDGTSGAAYGLDLPPSCQDDDDLRRLLRCRDRVSPHPFAVDDPFKAAFLDNSAGSLRAPAPAIGAHEEHDSFAFFPTAGDTFSRYSTRQRAATSSSPAAAAEDPPLGRRRRRNVRISSEPQTVAARLRREKVSERLRALRRLVPGGGSGKMDTASMLHQAACYLRFLKAQLARFQAMAADGDGRFFFRPPWNDNQAS